MQFRNLLPIGFGLLTLLAPVHSAPVAPADDTNTTSPANNTGPAHCDFYCAHRLILRTAYASAGEGFGMVLDTCDALDWCVNEAKDSCPAAINATITRIAAQAKTDTTSGLDYDTFNNLTLLSALNTVSARSARIAISMAQSLLESSNKGCSDGSVFQLEGIRWLMAQEEGPIEYDADKFEKELANMNDEPLELGLVKRDEGDDGDNGDDSDVLMGLWGLLGIPVLGVGGSACLRYDWIICKQISQLFRLFKGAKNILPETNMARTVIQDSVEALSDASSSTDALTKVFREVAQHRSPLIKEYVRRLPKSFKPVPEDELPQPSEADYPYYPPNPADDLPLGDDIHSPPGKLPTGTEQPPVPEGAELFRAETYDPTTWEASQVTVTKSITTGANEFGFPAWDVLDAAGNRVQTIWSMPEALSPMPGQWAGMPSGGGQFVRAQANEVTGKVEPVLNCLGEPVVASTSGVLNNLAPVAYAAGEDLAGGLGFGGGMLFNLFKAAGDVSSAETVIFDPKKGMVDTHDTGSDNHNDAQNEDDKPDEHTDKPVEDQDKPQENDDRPHNPPTTSMRATSTHHSNPTPTPTQTSMPHSAQETNEDKLPSTDQTNAQSTPASSTKLIASPTESSKSVISTSSVTSDISTTPTTLTTTTSAKQQPSATDKLSPTTMHVSGCKTIQDCPCSRTGPTCQIGDLPPECAVGAAQIAGMAFVGNTTWEECVTKIQRLDREEAKAWAAAITVPYCLSDSEWEPKDNGVEHGGECYLTLRGAEFAKVANVYVKGMLPLACPTFLQAQGGDHDGDGHWDGYSDDVEQKCRQAANVLGQPFLDFAEADHSVVGTWGETFCSLVPCSRSMWEGIPS